MSLSVISSGSLNADTCVSVDILSSASELFRAVTCLMAVRKAVGLKRPGSQTDVGVLMPSAPLQAVSCSQRWIRSANQGSRPFIDGHAYFSQDAVWNGFRPGTCLMSSADMSSSMTKASPSGPEVWPGACGAGFATSVRTASQLPTSSMP